MKNDFIFEIKLGLVSLFLHLTSQLAILQVTFLNSMQREYN